ncbi:MBL fold metallo-hydrolase [Fulvivirga sp. 29W222]|uniref:MBL fold metallo-hydrolase n=1 Tax=Fulvivirga marina TaxID=2494733 RepID=A0A937G146_9BACT|nr:MBL fold metallo-hydrolase [Fulvivirga marina]MBL6448065.1 MBL fold metallo-hydrolase [Fulvivirga marina]
MEKIEIQLIRNATLKIKYAGKTLLVDPALGAKHSFRSFVEPGKNLNPTVDLPITVEEVVADLDAILLTHTHPDHFDIAAVEILDKSLPFYAPPVDAGKVQEAGFRNVQVIEDKGELGDITITRTGGKHGPEEQLNLLGEVAGFVLQAGGYPIVYIIGDCIWDAEIENNLKTIKPDIVITNSGGAVFMGQVRILMNEEETIKVAKAVPDATVIAVHMEALDHCKTTRETLKAAAVANNIDVVIPMDGDVVMG